MSDPVLSDWIGHHRIQTSVLSASDLTRLAAVLSRTPPPEIAPPAWHWGCFPDISPQFALGVDGHPARGGFLPPIAAPRRMFAAADMRFHHPLASGRKVALRETIASIDEKAGKSGPLVFVGLDRELHQDGRLCVEERQTLVYRQADPGPAPAPEIIAAPSEADWSDRIETDPVLLFRFSAATFNSHRIHYDRTYAMEEENYPGLVVHGPLIALSLLEALWRRAPERTVTRFRFKAMRPLFEGAPFSVSGAWTGAGADLWAQAEDGGLAMRADVTLG